MTNSQSYSTDELFLSELFPTPEESFRCQHALTKLALQMREPPLVTGGLAVKWYLSKHGVHTARRPFNDIDVVIHDRSQLRGSLTQEFLIAHYHPTRGRGKILLQLAEEESRSRIDLVTPYSCSITERAQRVTIGGVSCWIVAAEDLAARLLCILYQVVIDKPVAPKYYESFMRLANIADMNSVAAIWHEYRDDWHTDDLSEAITSVHQTIAKHTHLLQPDVYSQAIDRTCPCCRHSEGFPLAPAARIHEIWGYV
jgi:hypothetical protein